MITKQDILEYVMNSPYNTNYTILKQMVEEIEGSGGSLEPKYVFDNIILGDGDILAPIDKSLEIGHGDLIEFKGETPHGDPLDLIFYFLDHDGSYYALSSSFDWVSSVDFVQIDDVGQWYMDLYDSAEFNPSGGFTPSGLITISSNGITNVYDYETAVVNVPTLTFNTVTVSGPSGYHIKAKNEYDGNISSGGLTIDTTSHQFYSEPITFKIPKIINHYYYLQLSSTDGRITAISGASGQTYCNRTNQAAAEVNAGDNLVLTMIDD